MRERGENVNCIVSCNYSRRDNNNYTYTIVSRSKIHKIITLLNFISDRNRMACNKYYIKWVSASAI